MSKCILEYSLPEDKEDLDCALNGAHYKHALWEVGQEVFRPARKHGYSDPRIQLLIELIDESIVDRSAASEGADNGFPPLPADWPKDDFGHLTATDLISMLEKLFHETIDRQGVSLD